MLLARKMSDGSEESSLVEWGLLRAGGWVRVKNVTVVLSLELRGAMGSLRAMGKRRGQVKTRLKFDGVGPSRDHFGGRLLKGNPKGRRPLDSKLPTHLVLRSRASLLRLPKTYLKVNEVVERVCRKHGVRLYRYANVGNHLHLLVRLRSRRSWSAFIRELTGRVAQIALELKPREKSLVRFWRYRPFTRVVRGWKKAFRVACEYVGLNQLEADGMIDRRSRPYLLENL